MSIPVVTYLRWILPAIFILYYGGIVSFTHVHIVNGVTIVHAHPYKRSDSKGIHHHSFAELQLYHQLSVLSMEDGAVQSVSIFHHTPFLGVLDVFGTPVTEQNPDEVSFYLRAPPFLFGTIDS